MQVLDYLMMAHSVKRNLSFQLRNYTRRLGKLNLGARRPCDVGMEGAERIG